MKSPNSPGSPAPTPPFPAANSAQPEMQAVFPWAAISSFPEFTAEEGSAGLAFQ